MWLVKLRWTNVKTGSPLPREHTPTHDTTMITSGQFTAFGRRQGFDCYLFINRTEAEIFKKRVEDQKSRNNPQGRKLQTHLVDLTPEDVAHLDLDPVRRKNRAAAPQI